MQNINIDPEKPWFRTTPNNQMNNKQNCLDSVSILSSVNINEFPFLLKDEREEEINISLGFSKHQKTTIDITLTPQ